MDRFRFKSAPFTRELKIEQRLKLAHIEQQISALKATVEGRQSGVLVAPAGTGKTVTLRALNAQLAAARYRVTYIKLTNLSARDMCCEIAAALNLASAGLFPRLVRRVEEKLHSGYRDGGLRQVMIFDDAHAMRPETFQLLRLLTNFEMDSQLMVSLILAGQMALKQMLCRDELADVLQRLVHCGELRLLSREEARQYVEHRTALAGASQQPFDSQALDAIFEITRGNMRGIDKLALASLQEADRAAKDVVDPGDVTIARARTWL